MEKTIYNQFKEFREKHEELLSSIKRISGRLLIGPSGKDGLYLAEKGTANKETIISNISREEAIFIAKSLIEIYGITQLNIIQNE